MKHINTALMETPMMFRPHANLVAVVVAVALAAGAGIATTTVPSIPLLTVVTDHNEQVARAQQRLFNDRARLMRADGAANSRWFDATADDNR
jgi:hypothetical protein